MKKTLSLLLLVLVLMSCGTKNENRPLKDSLSAFLKDNKTIVAFGEVDIHTILKKSSYETVPKFGLLVKKELEGLRGEINVDAPIYFALEGPIAKDGTPTTTYAFLEVKNADSLNANLTERGFDIEEDGETFFHASGDVAFGFKNNLLIIVSKKGEFDGKKLADEAFDKATGEIAGGKIDQILSAKGDLVMGVNIENLYGTSNTELSDLSKEKQKKLQKMVSNSFVQSTLNLEAGAAVFETKNLFSPDLAKQMFFKNDGGAKIISSLGTGNPRMGVSANLDMKKMQGFLDEFSPSALDGLAESMGGPVQFALMTAGDDGLAGLFSGQLGVVLVGETIGGGSMVPDFNFFVGMEKGGKTLANGAKTFLSAGMAQVDLTDKSLAGYTNKNFIPMAGKKISIPRGCEVFGKKGVTMFVNLDGMDMSQFDFQEEEKLIYLVKYMTFEMDNNGSRLYLKAKDDKENVMKQMVTLLVEELSDKISGMSL